MELVHAEMDSDFSLEELADAAGLSITHFSQMFRESTGQSPHQFVLYRRVDRAKELLRAAEMRVLDVAVACGFIWPVVYETTTTIRPGRTGCSTSS
jgi:AraC family transcriptional regulator